MKDRCQQLSTRLLPFLLLLSLGCQATQNDGSQAAQTVAEADSIGLERVPQRGFDVEHYALDIVLRPETRSIEATCVVRFTPLYNGLKSIELDLAGLQVHAIRDGEGRELQWTHTDERLTIQLASAVDRGAPAEVQVVYAGQPERGLWFSGGEDNAGLPTQVFTHGQPKQNSGWFPCLDHPSDRATSEVRVTMPNDWVSTAPGKRIELIEQGDTRVEHWRMDVPHPSYLVSLVAGRFEVLESQWKGVPLSFFVPPAYSSMAEASFAKTASVLEFLENYTGVKYPYSKYSQACVDNYPVGGMENISASTLSALTLNDARGQRDGNSTELVAHEAAHQWFGDLVSCRDWAHVWLNEGLATYMSMLYLESTEGPAAFRIAMRDLQDANIAEDKRRGARATVSSRWDAPEDLFDTRSYGGAAARLHLLRFWLGDKIFQRGVQTYVSENAGSSVTTRDLQNAFEKVSGRNLDDFFAQWIYGIGVPQFELSWSFDELKEEVTLRVRQRQQVKNGVPAFFRTPVEIEVGDDGGTLLHRIDLTQRDQSFRFAVAGRPQYVIFDQGGWLPKQTTWKGVTVREMVLRSGQDTDAGSRREAVRALGEHGRFNRERNNLRANRSLVIELNSTLRTDAVPAVRAAAASALGDCAGFEAFDALLQAAQFDAEASVRVAALDALGHFEDGDGRLAQFAIDMFEQGFSWKTMAAAAGLYCHSDPAGAYAWLTKKLFIESPHDQLAGLLLVHLSGLPSASVAGQLRRWARDTSLAPNARAVAAASIGLQRRELRENTLLLGSLLDSPNFQLRAAAVRALSGIRTKRAQESLRTHYASFPTHGERRLIEAALPGGLVRRR